MKLIPCMMINSIIHNPFATWFYRDQVNSPFKWLQPNYSIVVGYVLDVWHPAGTMRRRLSHDLQKGYMCQFEDTTRRCFDCEQRIEKTRELILKRQNTSTRSNIACPDIHPHWVSTCFATSPPFGSCCFQVLTFVSTFAANILIRNWNLNPIERLHQNVRKPLLNVGW